jgi:valyl-tRNA synthetase
MVTAPEILFFWVARMIMMGYEFFGEPPFTEVYLHGTVRDMKGRKMSKSLGNGIDPLEVVNAFGADAMRYTLVSQAAMGTDISLDHEDVEGAFANGRNFANKIWNAGRFVLLSLGDAPVRPLAEVESDLALEDRWMLSRVRSAAENATRGLERYRLHDVAESLYHFFWGEVCDWYLEFVKARLTENADAASREAARSTLVTVLDHSYRLLHPIVPFVTAELWSRLPWPEGDERPEDLIVAPWPDGSDGRRDEQAEQDFEALKELVVEVRRLRKEYGVPEAERIQIRLTGGDSGLLGTVRSQSAALERLARIGGIHEGEGSGIGAHAVLSGGTELFVPLEGVIDLDRERSRLRGEIERLQGLSAGASKKLDNENFVSRAPDEVVQKERDKLAQYDEQASKLQEKLAELEGGAS